MSNFRKFISMSAVAVLGATNLLTPLSYASAATKYDSLTESELKQSPLTFEMPDKDVFLKALTEANKYYVTYSGNKSTAWSMGTGTFTYDTTWHLDPLGFQRLWYTFDRWNTQANGGGTPYESGAAVWNWTTEENEVIPIYAIWTPNGYSIHYDLNDTTGTSSWVHSKTPTSATYDKEFEVVNPTRTWYAFSGWTITNMDSNSHIVGWQSGNRTSKDGVMWTGFKNLLATSGTVNFKATWSKNLHTPYTVEHYLQTLTWGYPAEPKETDHLSWTTDTEVKPAIHVYTWFTANPSNTPKSGNINADGSGYFRYEYTRNNVNLTLKAGRWIASVKWSGQVTPAQSGTSVTIPFKYDEPVTLSFEYKQWYTWWTWSGYKNAASSFNMPEFATGKTAYATPIVYNITYNDNGWVDNNPANPAQYTVESGDIVLWDPTGNHSDFLWWTWSNWETPQKNVKIASGSIWDKNYTAAWKCHTWYHPGNGSAWDNRWNCNPDTDTEYRVNHMLQNLDWNAYNITWDSVIQTWTTDQLTNATVLPFTWFTMHQIDSANIEWDKSTVVQITYDRLSYTWTIANPAWGEASSITSASAVGAHTSSAGKYKYDDTVTLSATLADWYDFVSWTVKDASGNTVTVTNPGNINGATFKMPASSVTITPTVNKKSYTITYITHSWTVIWGAENPTSYTVETPTFTLVNLERDNSIFVWWSGWVNGKTPTTSDSVEITKWFTWDRTYEAIWTCRAWYHASGANECVANTYHVDVPNLNWTGHWAPDNIVFTYDSTGTLPDAPSQSWYDFVWWEVTWMSGWVNHYIGEIITTGDTYTYSGTSIEFMNLTTENGGRVTLTAIWTPRDDTEYKVEHYYKDEWADTYTQNGATEIYTWTTDSTLTLADLSRKNLEWFTYDAWYVDVNNTTVRPTTWAVETTTIEQHGYRVIKLYYTRNEHTVYLSGDAHIATLSGAGTFEYGKEVTVSATVKSWYHFKEWKRKANSGFVTDY